MGLLLPQSKTCDQINVLIPHLRLNSLPRSTCPPRACPCGESPAALSLAHGLQIPTFEYVSRNQCYRTVDVCTRRFAALFRSSKDGSALEGHGGKGVEPRRKSRNPETKKIVFEGSWLMRYAIPFYYKKK